VFLLANLGPWKYINALVVAIAAKMLSPNWWACQSESFSAAPSVKWSWWSNLYLDPLTQRKWLNGFKWYQWMIYWKNRFTEKIDFHISWPQPCKTHLLKVTFNLLHEPLQRRPDLSSMFFAAFLAKMSTSGSGLILILSLST
jgi:hypothetical protein